MISIIVYVYAIAGYNSLYFKIKDICIINRKEIRSDGQSCFVDTLL